MKHLAISLLAGTALLGFASASYAADLIIEEPMPVVGVVDVGGNWDGFYLGAFAGYGWGRINDENDWFEFDDENGGVDVDGFMLGLTAGADFTIGDGVVAGVVGDIAWGNFHGDAYSVWADYDTAFDVSWLGSLRGKLGFDGGAFLPYLTAGLAVIGGEFSVDEDPDWTSSNVQVGWTVGAGVEFAIAENVSLDLLYRYSDYGTAEFDGYFDPGAELGLTAHTIQAGINWRF